MSKRFTITEDEKRQIKGLYLINEEVETCQNEKFKITDGDKFVKNPKTGKEEFTRVELTNEAQKTKDYLVVNRYCNGNIEHSYQAYIKDGKLFLEIYID
jgi:hypothetical protein